MNENEQTKQQQQPEQKEQQPLIINPANMDNAVLKRLIGEIDFEKVNRLHAYNRTHNRHNRGR
jgi:hypothetical protein